MCRPNTSAWRANPLRRSARTNPERFRRTKKPWRWPRLFSCPVACDEVFLVQLGLGRAGLGLPVVTPFHDRRQRHQDGFSAPARLQAEQRAAVENQVEFDIAAAAVGLKITFAFAVVVIAATFDDRQIGVEEGVADRAGETESLFERQVAVCTEVVEEQAANAARLVAVFE